MALEGPADPPVAKRKSKTVPLTQLGQWEALLEPQSELLQEILEHESRCDDFLVQFGASLRSGVLASSPHGIRVELLGLFERHCGQLCRAVEVNRLRMIYETLRDNLSSVQQDGSDKAAQLRNAALKSLTRALVTLDIPRRDPRLLKFHVELLLRFLTPEPLLGKVDTATQLAGQDRRVLAAECLRDLEAAFPGLLAVEAYALLDLAGKEITRPTPGFLCTQLSATVLSNLAAAYLRQQEEGTLGPAVDPAVFDLDEDAVIASDAEAAAPAACLLADGELAGSASTDEVLQQAADALADPRFAPELHLGSPASSDSAEPELPGTPSAAAADTRRQTSQYPADVARGQPASTFRESGQPKEASRGSGNSSPSGVLPAAAAPSVVTSVASRHSSRHSNLASATEADADDTATSLPRSALTAALRINSIGSAFSDAPTPRAALSEMPVLHKTTSPLRRFVVPLHLQTGVAGDMPRLIMDAESQTALQAAAASLVSVMRRLDAGAVAVVAKALPPVLLAARPSPTQLWPFFERHLSAGSTALLRAVLDIHDAVPSLFEGRGPSLVEKVLHQVNDPALSADHRLAAVSWVMRQHAQQCHSGGALLLADCWEQLLPRGREPPELAAIKVKALAACLSAGVGDEEVVCRAVCTWEGFGDVRPSEQQLRALTYALRTLHSATPEDSPTVHRARACLVAGILEAIVARPQLVKGVDAFLATCSFEFTATFLRAFNALLGSVEGQFDVLRERPEDAAFEGTTVELAQRVKAAVISRSSSLSGLMRGLSFKLSFTKRTHSVLPSARGSGFSRMPSTTDGGANDALDVRALRSSIAAAFNTRADGPPTASAGAQTPRSSVARAVPVTLGPVRPSAIGAYGSEIEEPPMEVDPSTPFPVAPPVPLSIPDAEAAEAWLSAPATWECLAVGVLRHDLMSYRTLMQRALNSLEVHPCATLRTLANFTWQYKEPHPSHALSAKETAHAILALCHTAALGHLPCPHGEGWSARQCEVAASVHSVLDALEEGFPVPSARVRSRILAERVEDESAWHVESKGATLGALLCGYIDAAVEA